MRHKAAPRRVSYSHPAAVVENWPMNTIMTAGLLAAVSMALLPAFATWAQELPPPVRIVSRPAKIAQLVGDMDRERGKPTANRTGERYKLFGTDLGVSFRHKDRTWLLFGDTWGPRGGDAIAWTADRSPEKGLNLTFLHDDAGAYSPVIIPGISQGGMEVPMAGVSVRDRMYVYHTTDNSPRAVMGRSVVARSDDDGHTFRYLYDLSKRHFINVSVVKCSASDWSGLPVRRGETLLLFGSGSYRRSDVRLAVQPSRDIESPNSLRYFSGLDSSGRPSWSAREEDAVALFNHPCVGELSVTFNRFLRRWIMLYNGYNPRGILLRTAERPWGPWSSPQVLFEPWDDGGYGKFMHVSWQVARLDSVQDPGRDNEWGGEYGPYQFPDFATGKPGETTIYFAMSTWNPYTIVLMKAALSTLPVSEAQ
jgi:hypothetical protein